MSKISGYANSVSALGTDDLIDVSEKISSSPDVYESRKMTGATLATFIQNYTNDSIYSASGTVPSSVVAAITDFLRFSGGRLDLSTTTDGFLMPRLTTAQMNAIASPTTNLLIYNTDLSGLYRYNGSAWVALSTGYGVISVNDSSGQPTFYASLTAAVAAASSGDVVTFHSDITESGAVEITIDKEITINLNGHSYIHNDSTNLINSFNVNIAGTSETIVRFLNGTIERVKSAANDYGTIYNNSDYTTIDLNGATIKATNTRALRGFGTWLNGYVVHSGASTPFFIEYRMFNTVIESATGGTLGDNSNAIIKNVIFNSASSGITFTGSLMQNCTIISNDSNNTISLSGSGKIVDCYIQNKGSGYALNSTSGSSEILGCKIVSNTGSRCVNLDDAQKIKKSVILASTGNALVMGKTASAYECYIYSASSSACQLYTNADIYNSTIISGSSSGYALLIPNFAGTSHIINNHLETAATTNEVVSMSGAGASKFIYWAKNRYKGGNGSITFGTNGNSQTSTEDTFGNIQID